jgi:hypothetical protein
MKTQNERQNRYQGMTRKEYKRMKARTCSEPGKNKTLNCQATGLEKGLTKYPRSIKTSPAEYFNMNLKKDKFNNRNSFFTHNQ